MSGNKNNTRIELDEIMKVLFRLSNKVTLNMINNLFSENFDLNTTKIEYSNPEFVSIDSNQINRIQGDLFLSIEQNAKSYLYHIEFQTLNDNSMVLRMFQYGFEKAMERIDISSNNEERIIDFPKQLVIYIEENNNIDDNINLKIRFPDNQSVLYKVPVIKYWKYNAEDLKRKKLYSLLPLQVFSLRKELNKIVNSKIEKEEKKILIKAEFEKLEIIIKELLGIIKKSYEEKEILGYDLQNILDVIKNLSDYLYLRFDEYLDKQKEVKKMFQTLVDPIMCKEKFEEGKREGEKERKKEDARNFKQLGVDIEIIRKATGLTRKEIEEL